MPLPTPLSQLKTALQSNDDVAKRAHTIVTLAPSLPSAALALLDEGLTGADPLVQVAIMDAYFEMTDDDYHQDDLERIMEEASHLGDAGEELYMAARLALGRVTGSPMDTLDEWGDSELDVTAVARRRGGARARQGDITVIIHGTWAANGDWWRPDGDFFEYTRVHLGRDDLYDQEDQFRWSGKNREGSRQEAGLELDKWLRSHPARVVNVLAHSHGANIAMLATRQGVRIDRLVMLSPPVRTDYFADWSKVGSAFNIQASSDPVVALAKGGQHFGLPQVAEKRLEASGHSASHDPGVWQTEHLAGFVGIPW